MNKMNIKFLIEIHVYESEELYDEILEEGSPHYGVMGKEIITPLRKNKKCELLYNYSDATEIGESISAIIDKVTDGKENVAVNENNVAFMANGLRYFVDDISANLKYLINKYFDPQNTGVVHIQILICADAGGICTEDNIRYYMHSKESGKHNKPHVHVEDTSWQYEASIDLSNGDILAGELPTKMHKIVKKKIEKERRFFYECWNTMTDGLEVDINKEFGYIHY